MKRLLLISLFLSLAAGCSLKQKTGGYYKDDGPHKQPLVDVSTIPDAVPKAEPPSPHGNKPYTVFGRRYYPSETDNNFRERGIASWYGKKFHGKKTSNGEIYDMYGMTAAHKTLILPTYMRIRNLENGLTVIVRVNDRGPFLHNRVIDLSYAAAAKIGILATGTGIVEIETVTPTDTNLARDTTQETEPPQETAMQVTETKLEPSISTPQLFLQVGAFINLTNAQKIHERLEQAEIRPSFIETATVENEQNLYRVRIGPLATVEESDRMARRVLEYGIHDAHIVIE